MASHQQLNSVPMKSSEKNLYTFMGVELDFCCFLSSMLFLLYPIFYIPPSNEDSLGALVYNTHLFLKLS